jgi:hypothetical protein
MKNYFVYIVFIATSLIVLVNCNSEQKESPYLNVQDKNAHYVGMQECRSCHWQIYETFIQTGMGKSWGIANKQKSAADFSPAKALVYDSVNNFYYKPFWDGDSLYILEYRLEGRDTIHKRLEKVSYIVGSGQHTNSHLININGYLHQAPITFYTQKGKWDLAPGFEKGLNARFDRKIEMECITCHNGYPQFEEGSFNKFSNVPLGIDCERCHGPGSIHVTNKRKGDIVDTSKGPDFSIVNPRRMTTEQQNNLCQRCHLQGITTLNDDKTFFDFKPSQELKKTMNTFMPIYEGSEQNMIMASHVERMKMSNCYINSGKMSCISCHNPHVSVKFTKNEVYINACKSCHPSNKLCKPDNTQQTTENCIACHMPKNGSIDIPHVAVTDHYIRIPNKKITESNKNAISKFVQLKCYNNDRPENKIRARAFLEFYERYTPSQAFLDSTFYYLKKAGVDIENDFDKELIRAYYLKENYQKIISLSDKKTPASINDAWTNYRIGEAFYATENYTKAIAYFKQACVLKPFVLDFQNKLATTYVANNNLTEAKKVCQFIIKEHPRYGLANFNLGYIAMQENNLPLAKYYYEKSLQINPDHVQTLINLAVVYYQTNQKNYIIPLLNRALKIEPTNEKIKAMIADLK